jgi:hypothetical protein
MIPANLSYTGKIESSPARRYRTNIQPQNGTGPYVGGNTVIVNIPCQANTFLIPSESYLKFTLSAVIGATASAWNAFDAHGAHGVFQRLRVYHGSSLLQDIDNYDDLAKILFDYQAALDTTQGRLSITNGTNAEYTGVLNGAAGTATVSNVKPTNKGATIASLAASGTRVVGTYCINLLSLVGALAGGKYIPLHFAQSSPLRVELVLKSTPQQVGAFTGNATGIQLTNVEYIAEFLQMSSGAIDAIASRASGALQMVIPDWRNYVYSSNVADNATISMPVAAKFSSLKSLVVSQRQTAASGVATYYPTAHVKNGLSQWTIRIGSELLPSTAPNSDAEFFSEAAKCFGSLADMNYQPSIDINAFTQNAAVAITSDDLVARTDSGAFLIGLDCETYQNSDKTSIFAGMDTTTSDIFVNMVYGTTPSSGANITYNAFACFDNVIVFENGTIYSRT